MEHPIDSKKAYHETMVAIYNLMNKGEANLTVAALKMLAAMAAAVEKYEDEMFGLKSLKNPGTLP